MSSGTPATPKPDLLASRDAIIGALNSPQYAERITAALRQRGIEKPDPKVVSAIIASAIEALTNDRRKGWEKLVQCTPSSVLDATLSLVAMGLAPDYERKIGFFRPGFNKDRKCWEAVGIPGVRGLEMMVFATGVASNLHGAAVRRQDQFEAKQNPDGWALTHIPSFNPDDGKDHGIYAAWATIGLKDGRKVTVVMPIKEADLTNDVMARFRNTEAYYRAERAALRMFCRTILQDPETRAKCRNVSALETYEDVARRLGQAEDGEAIGEDESAAKSASSIPATTPVAVETVPAERISGDQIPEVPDVVPNPAAVPSAGDDLTLPVQTTQVAPMRATPAANSEPSPVREIMKQTESAFRPSRRRW